MRNPFRRRRPIPNRQVAAEIRLAVYRVKHSAIRQVALCRMLGLDDLLIISHVNQAVDDLRAPEKRGARLFAREVERLVHANPSEGNPL